LVRATPLGYFPRIEPSLGSREALKNVLKSGLIDAIP
jgi:hypothetical protein